MIGVERPRIAVAWTGASGLAYGVRLVEALLGSGTGVDLVVSPTVAATAAAELDVSLADVVAGLRALGGSGALREHAADDFASPLASGSAAPAGMAVCPCSMGTLARIAAGTSETLLLRAADVCLKERRPLVLVPRETPLASHHLENMLRLSRNGAVILPAMPGFYHRPRTVADLVDFVVQRVCDHLGVAVDLVPRWGTGPGGPGGAGGPAGGTGPEAV